MRVWILILLSVLGVSAAEPGRLQIQLEGSSAGQEVLAARVHIKTLQGKPVLPDGFPGWKDHFIVTGQVSFPFPAGKYRWEMERGPEFSRQSGELAIAPGQTNRLKVELDRWMDLPAEGWWSGDLHIHRPPEIVPLLMQAESLHFGGVITWWNQQNLWKERTVPSRTTVILPSGRRAFDLMGGEDERAGGALLFFGLKEPVDLTKASHQLPSAMDFARQVLDQGGWVDIEKPFWWDMPIWVAHGIGHTIGIANNHMCRSEMYESEAWGHPRDSQRLPPPLGNGFWTQEIYYHLLNCGIRIPPSAGSASGVLPNPVGYNRVYVNLQGGFSPEAWVRGLHQGRSFVSNGPLLRCQVNKRFPGEVFRSTKKPLDFHLQGRLDSRDPIKSVELVINGTARSIPLESDRLDYRFTLQESGWFLVRALADVPHTFRFASTAPFYVEIGTEKKPVSRASAQFFFDWLQERREYIVEELEFHEIEELGRYLDSAERFWVDKLSQASRP